MAKVDALPMSEGRRQRLAGRMVVRDVDMDRERIDKALRDRTPVPAHVPALPGS